MGITSPEGWYSITLSDIANRGGMYLLKKYYRGSLIKALKAIYTGKIILSSFVLYYQLELVLFYLSILFIYPSIYLLSSIEHPWLEWKRYPNLNSTGISKPNDTSPSTTSTTTAPSTATMRDKQLFDWIAKQLDIQKPEDWYKVRATEINKRIPSKKRILEERYEGSIIKALKAIYPDYQWQAWKFEGIPHWNAKEMDIQVESQCSLESISVLITLYILFYSIQYLPVVEPTEEHSPIH